MTIAAGSESGGTAAGLPSDDTSDLGSGPDVEDVVRLGDEHVRGVETLCVGESQ